VWGDASATRKALAVVLALLSFGIAERFIAYDILSRVDRFELVLAGEGTADIRVFFQRPPATRAFDVSRMVQNSAELDEKERVFTKLGDTFAVLYRIEFETGTRPLLVREIRVHSRYAPSFQLKGEAIGDYFQAGNELTRIETTTDGMMVRTDGGASSITSTRKTGVRNPYLRFGLPFIIGGVVFFLALRFNAARVPSFAQLQPGESAGIKPHNPELDGLRGLAALSVVADHTWGIFSGSGLVGVWIFFALSGYLLAIPFVHRPDMVFDGSRLQNYFFRRLARIVPMYYSVIFVYYLASGYVQWALPHFLFLQGDGHFWTIPQEMFFYLLLPFIMMGMALLLRLGFVAALTVLTGLTLWLLWDAYIIPFELNGRPHMRPLMLGWFLTGVLASYVLNNEGCSRFIERYRTRMEKTLGWLATIVLVTAFLAGSSSILSGFLGYNVFPAFEQQNWFGIAAGFLVFSAVYARNSVYGVILRNRALRSFGIIGYSAYLIHPLLIDVLGKLFVFYMGTSFTGFPLFVVATLLTWCVASFTYNVIEYPFLKRGTVRSE
jgi:peptidoglycan/LPS O-acetylase OafA/YrhL